MARRRNRILVPEARKELDRLKCELALEQQGIEDVTCSVNPNDIKYEVAENLGIPLRQGDNGDLTTRQAGKVGGQLGGSMVRKLVEIAQQKLAEESGSASPRS
jgi:small acid-soluble spore protein D (minor alpha/beta-type SASP)